MPFDGQKLSTVTENLIKAKAYMEKGGWCRGSYFEGDKSCMMGALHSVIKEDADALTDAAVALWQSADRSCYINVPDINDNCLRSKEEALAWFDAAIAYSIKNG